jgi:cysteine-rich repeat protein
MSARSSTFLSNIGLALVLAACGAGAREASPDASVAQPDATIITGVGNNCATGCAGADVCANASTSCEHGYCLFDGRGDTFDSYCTKDCSVTGCPSGYHCEDVPFALDRACVADPAVCGNHVVERGEVCDDGNTGSDDGCRADCLAADTPLGDQRRVRATMTVSGSYVPKGGVATPFTTTASVDTELNSSTDCGAARDTAVGSYGSSQWRRFMVHGCANQIEAVPEFNVPYAVGTVTGGFPHLCAVLHLPPPDDARLVFCSTGANEQLTVETMSTTANGTNLTGNVQGTLAYIPNEAIGGCDGYYATGSCPDATPTTISVTATFDIVNAP